jgi:ribosomal protein L14
LINIGSILSVSDNSGALFGCCLNVLKKSQHIGCSPGQTLVLNVKKSKIILKGQICKALMIKSIRGLRR